MGRPSKRQKPTFAKNAISRQKALGWSAEDLAKAAKLPYPTVRDILAGISPGLEENRLAIARALGATLSELYYEAADEPPPQYSDVQVRQALQNLAKMPEKASMKDLEIFLFQLQSAGQAQRALALALLAGDYEVARPLVDEDYPSLLSLLKAL